ncbi:MAG: hypothetical protein GX061_08310 [Eubacteriaceae bacterium]|nr:hypothetical protein [Eubacteriaceae bacterium]
MLSYRDLLKAKRVCARNIHIFALSGHIMTALSCLQTLALYFKRLFPASYLELVTLNKLFSMGYLRAQSGNRVFAACLYSAFCAITVIFIVCSACSLFAVKIKYPFYYYIPILIYAADTVLCIATGALLGAAIHTLLIVSLCFAVKYQKFYHIMGSDLWG